ncbi:hypothetical protein AVEN_84337-1 [Araneus ventricosus]|uniref:DUF7041 domain-containing protein n=1 Tax=Araneus ventricosus TaxID=182803 RepID=A0A4Y2UYH9_ARAVE|nr:hypothetical protein AVEN_84337-1 [Araneus ventricosus]
MPDGPESTNPELARVAFRAPKFWETDFDLWFLQLESQFKLSSISTDETKFHTVVAALDSKILSCVSDIVRNPPADNKYDALKTRILNYFSQLRLLLQDLQLGDKKASQLSQEMTNLAAEKVSEDVLKTIWMQRLLTSIQQILSVSNDNFDGLSLIADKVNEVSHFDTVVNAVASDYSLIQSFRDEIAKLRAEIKRISRPRFRQSSRGRQNSKSRVRSTSNSRKLKVSSVSAATDGGHNHSRLFLYDRSTGFRFLMDSGAAVSCLPRRLTKHKVAQGATLYVANGSAIKYYRTKQINLDLGLRRKFSWCFLIADVSHPIIGSDFLERFEPLIDIKNRRLIDSLTFMSAKGVNAPGNTLGLTLISNKSPFHTILSKFGELFSPMSEDVEIPHNVEHCIETGGPPVFPKLLTHTLTGVKSRLEHVVANTKGKHYGGKGSRY